jgi:hypothetical protein
LTASVCYFIQSHRDPEQIYRLVRTLRAGSPAARIVVQHNFAACPLDWSPLADLPRTHLYRACERQVRAHFSCQVQPYLDIVDWLEAEGFAYDWLVNLTAQDYPVVPIAEIEARLETASCDAFIRYWEAGSADSPWSWRKPRNRYWHRYVRLSEGMMPVLRSLHPLTRVLPIHFYLDYGPLVGFRRFRTPFGPGFRCHGGWAWFNLRRSAALYLRRFLVEHPEIEAHYRGSVAPEESIVQTILANSGQFKLVNDDRRYIDYSGTGKGGSPRTLTVADMPLLASGRYDFARKFDLGVDRAVLDRIDRELLGLAD